MTDYSTQQSTVPDLLHAGAALLRAAGVSSPQREAEELLAASLGCRPLAVYLARTVDGAQAARFLAWIQERAAGTPVPYLTGRVRFCDEEFVVNRETLIPRPETELLVEATLELARTRLGAHPRLRCVDIGTGSGAVAVSLTRQLPSARMLAIDRSFAALKIARLNAVRLGVARQLVCVQGDGLQALARTWTPHIVVANPPYIVSRDLAQLPREVQQEPTLALDGGGDGCRVHAAWLRQAAEQLATGGCVLCELGDGQAEAVAAMARATGQLRVLEIRRDWAGILRVLIAQKIHG